MMTGAIGHLIDMSFPGTVVMILLLFPEAERESGRGEGMQIPVEAWQQDGLRSLVGLGLAQYGELSPVRSIGSRSRMTRRCHHCEYRTLHDKCFGHSDQ